MQIGLPTDVKHVAHIGWDGPSVNSTPSWMNDFKGHQSAPLGPGTGGEFGDLDAVKWVSEDSKTKRSARDPNSPARDMPELPKSSRRSLGSPRELPAKEKSDKQKQSRRSSKSREKDLLDRGAKPRKPKVPSQISEKAFQESRHKSRQKKPIGGGSRTEPDVSESESVIPHSSEPYQPSALDFEEEEKRLNGLW
ncbi:hypothetical protein SLA2020_153540 [Shorea laevis]